MAQRKMSIDEYLDQEFTADSRPCRKTVVNWIKKGVVPGVELGGKFWVYEQITVADQLIDKVLRKAS
ncbi:hypothetical protein [Amphritea sp. HPY]|uniref:hypothetical protein n=1 Tax=Amphritea sp. HPY TaxID=3421652 RepID=UPI003D7DAB5C